MHFVNYSDITRSAGILLHPISLYSEYGVGDFGENAYQFIDFLKKSGQKYWQILPLNPTGYRDSPYQALSAFAGNHILTSPEKLIDLGFISRNEVQEIYKSILPFNPKLKIDYNKLDFFKLKILEYSYFNFKTLDYSNKKTLFQKYNRFCHNQKHWLENYVLYYSIKKHHDLISWIDWPTQYAFREKEALSAWKKKHEDELEQFKFIQWIFHLQWDNLHKYAAQNGIQIVGDMAIFVAHDSADVWANQKFFTLNSDGSLEYQAGVPPDNFTETGQLWGNPLYRWKLKKPEINSWFINRFKHMLQLVDWIRVDHFRGFESYWRIPGNAKNAIKGDWIKGPGKNLFEEIEKRLGKCPIIVEDLGVITPEVNELRDTFNFPGMRILQSAFSTNEDNFDLPHNYVRNCIAYSGTHDNDTLIGWWNNSSTEEERQHFLDYFNENDDNIVQTTLKGLYRSIANIVIFPMQDILGQNSEDRMNLPGSTENNWMYRLTLDDLSNKRARWLKSLVIMYGRLPKPIND